MSHEEVENEKAQHSLSEKKRQKVRNDKRKKDKEDNPKGYVLNEADWLLTDDFVEQETKTGISDAKYRDEKEGYHYLDPMEEVCGYCGALGFKAEVQGYFEDKNGKKQCHFGQIYCNKGKVQDISDYYLPDTLERLYTSDDEQSIFFRNNARECNNAFAMSSFTCKNKWQTRAHNNKFDAMLTAQGQLMRRIGPLLPTVDGVNPKCVQAYFYGGDDATKWRMTNGVKNNFSKKEKPTYETLFKLLDNTLKNDAGNKYLESFYGVKEYIGKN
jgi:hypothetical protein